jgi:hypothetical protein
MDGTLKKCINEAFFEASVVRVMKGPEEERLIQEDPVEWVRKEQDFMETLQDPKKIMITLIQRVFGEYSE